MRLHNNLLFALVWIISNTVFANDSRGPSAIAATELATLDGPSMDRNWSVQKYFGHIKVISCDTTSERFRRCQRELAAIGLTSDDYEVIRGVDGTTLDASVVDRMTVWDKKLSRKKQKKQRQGQTGCFMAHYRAIKETATRYKSAQERLAVLQADAKSSPQMLRVATKEVAKYSSLLIIEDNVGFGKVTGPLTATFNGYGRLFRLAMKELRDDWDMFYFLSFGKVKKISTHLGRLTYGLSTKCYAIHSSIYERVLRELEIIDMPYKKLVPIDHTLAWLHRRAHCFVPLTPLCYRAASESLVGGDKEHCNTHWQCAVTVS